MELISLSIAVAMLITGLVAGYWLARRPHGAALAAAAAAHAAAVVAQQAALAEVAALTDANVLHRLKHSETVSARDYAHMRLAELAGVEAARSALAIRLAAVEAERSERDRSHTAEVARTAETFAALAGQALDAAHLKLAEANEAALTRHREAAGAGLETNRAALAELIAPMRETLAKYEVKLDEVEKARTESYGQLNQLLDQVAKGQDRVSSTTQKLENVLRSSGKAAGRWGEEQCRNVLEQAGLVENIDFVTQTADGSDDSRRPDFIVTLPGDRKLVIDVKCSLDAFMAAAGAAPGAEGDDDRGRHLLAHAKAVRAHATGLASKAYEKSIGGAVDFVVLFVPG